MECERAADPHFVSRVVEVSVDYDGSRCQWTLTDQGKGFDVDVIGRGEPADETDLLRPSGRGILMMRALLDDVRYEAGGRRVVLTLRRRGEEQRSQARIEHQQPVQVAPTKNSDQIAPQTNILPSIKTAVIDSVFASMTPITNTGDVNGMDRLLTALSLGQAPR